MTLPRFDLVEVIKAVVIWTVGAIYVVLFACIIVGGFWLYATSNAKAHDFYPRECCSGTDCAPVPSHRVSVVAGGYLIDGRHFIFESQTRVSPDQQYHGCFPTPAILQCFFAPKPSM